MTTPTRTPGRLGRKPNAGRPRIRLTATHKPPAYLPPATLDRYSAVPVDSWGMDGNGPDPSNPPDVPDGAGDCTFADMDHELKSAEVAAGNGEVASTATEVLHEYEVVTGYNPADPSTDAGAEMQTTREFWQKTGLTLGGTVHKILMFAELDIHDVTVAQWALEEFGLVGVGVNLPQSAMDQFNAGQTWDVVANDGGILGGHAIAMVGYDQQGPFFASWGKVVKATWAWWSAYVEEAWGGFTSEAVNARSGASATGETLFQLGQQFASLTGQPNPVPAPGPAPTPSPPPAPQPVPPAPSPAPDTDPADVQLVATAGAWANEEHLTHGARVVAQAIRTFRAAKGL